MNNLQAKGGVKRDRLVEKTPFYYGWVILVTGSLGMVMTSPGQSYFISIFYEYFHRDLEISRSAISFLFMIGTLVGSFSLPWIGKYIDQWGSRKMVVLIAIFFGISSIFMGFIRSAVMLGTGFVLVRTFGKGGMDLVSINVINQWWVGKRGTMLGVSGLVMYILGIGSVPSLINWLIPLIGWRETYIGFGAVLLLIMAPIGWFTFRDHPEDYGLEPDGRTKLDDEKDGKNEEHWTLQEALGTPAFWIYSLGMFSIAVGGSGLFIHMVGIVNENGLNSTVAAAIYFPIGMVGALIGMGSGILSDKIDARYLLVFGLILQTGSLLMAQFVENISWAILYGTILGATLGFQRTVRGVIWATYFGRAALGSISGVAATMLVVGTAVGPVPLGLAKDLTGSYNSALVMMSILPLLLAIICTMIKPPKKADVKGALS